MESSQDQLTTSLELNEHPSKGSVMSSTDAYPPLIGGGSSSFDVPQVSSLTSLCKSWMEVAVTKPTNADRVKMKPRVPKPFGSKEVLNATSEEEEAVTNSFTFLMKVPRCDDSILQGQIDLAKLEVDENSRFADAIQVQIQEKRANIRIHELDYENAKYEDRKARSSMKSVRMEINSLMYVISRGNDALSVEDINRQLEKMEHMIQHETLSSKREKKIFSEIKQLKKRREELLAFLGSQDEIEQALEGRDEAEGRLKILNKELDILKDVVVRAEAAAVEAQKKCDAENRSVKELQAKCRAANSVRQSAYNHWQSLRKELSVKNKHFFQYKDDAAAAKSCAFSGNKKALHHLCTNQVEKLMQLWNTNDEFRQEYVKSNVRSTVRRLGTLDGRSLGHGEKPHVLPAPQERVDMMTKKSAPTVEARKSKQEPELTKKAEEMLREDTERLRLEQLAKAEVEAQKKEEEKEKARQKRLRKKEKKKAKRAEAAMDICETAAESSNKHETAAESSNKHEDVELPEKLQRQLRSEDEDEKLLELPEKLQRQLRSEDEDEELLELPEKPLRQFTRRLCVMGLNYQKSL